MAASARRRPATSAPIAITIVLLLSISISSSSSPQHDPRELDRSALLEIKRSVSGDLAGWLAGDHCSWPGVSCDSRCRVVALTILSSCPKSGAQFVPSCRGPGRRLAGELSPAIGDLSELKTLSFPLHNLRGEIPREIWRLEKLEVVDLAGNSLAGTLPARLPQRIRVLNLASNLIEGEIPRSLSKCSDLQTLDLSGNRLDGSVPGFLGRLPKLKELALAFNRLNGAIPEEIGARCRSLRQLDLSGNLLVGSIPSNLGNCTQLRSLQLFSNLLDGPIPSNLGRLGKLRVLDVSRNSLSGPVPAELGNCLEMSVLVLSNQFSPVPLKDLSRYVGDDEYNAFEGGIPENIAALPKLRLFWAPRAGLEGRIPSNWGKCESLEMVNLGENFLTGEVPRMFGQCKNLRFLNLSSNILSGSLDKDLPLHCMSVLDVSGNWLSGSIPRFAIKRCSPQFPSDDLLSAYSSGFASKALAGISLPNDSAHYSVVYHNFGKNNLSGPVTSLPVATDEHGNQTVYAFLADGNNIMGSLDAVLLEKCSNLKGLIINFRDNKISGGLTTEVSAKCRALMALDLAGNQISGMMPRNIGLLNNLLKIDFSRNWLQGQIPASFKELESLKFLSLAGNNLSGHIPSELGKLKSLEILDLSSNSLSGEIPSDLVMLRNLTVLRLDSNELSGHIPPPLASAPSLSMFNISFNNLSGPLPLNVSSMTRKSVCGNPSLQPCELVTLSIPPSGVRRLTENLQPDTHSPPDNPTPDSGNSGFSSIEIASITSASAIVAVLLALIILYIYRRKCASRPSGRSFRRREVMVFVDIGAPLTYESVVRATGNFNASNCIGSGGFGATYKAEIAPGVLVAIKRLAVGRFQGVQQFQAEVKTLGRCRHANLVTLIGFHLSDSEMFLIYNYLPGGNLERFIQERSKRPIDWRMLHKIALDIARALAYLHDNCVPRILHRDVKPSNILLDNEYTAYLSDFGLARLLGNSETHATTGVAGTFGYVAPEYAMTCRVSDKADVYSYGVVLLELISDKKALDPSFSPYGNGFNIVTWACMLLQKGRAREFFIEGLWDVAPHDDLVEILHLGIKCTVDSLSSRPTMKQVVRRLKELRPPSY